MKRLLGLGVVAASLVAPFCWAPRSEPALPVHQASDGSQRVLRTVDDVVEACTDSGLDGWELVDLATGMVNSMMTHYSCWHLWLTPERALAAGHGSGIQYNLALRQVLRRLGYRVRAVHASRVRLEHHPWYHVGHTWLHVTHAGRTLDVCASRPGNRAGHVAFVPVTEVRPFRAITLVDQTVVLAPIVAASVWRSTILRRPVERWVYRPFGESA